MNPEYSIRKGQPNPLGVTCYETGINIAIDFPHSPKKSCGMIVYGMGQGTMRIPFCEEYRVGNLYCVWVSFSAYHAEEMRENELSYLFFLDDELRMDPYAREVRGREKWGKYTPKPSLLRAKLQVEAENFAWEGDRPLAIPYEDSILYSLHVRGFTKHVSSGVKHKGTFEGLVEKIPYMKQLGITAVECMPIYEFDEIIRNPAYQEVSPQIEEYMKPDQRTWEYRINYWGFSEKDSYYFAPKASYSADKNAVKSCKEMIKQLHANGIELIMQMYFPPQYTPGFIAQVLHTWVVEYHVDGFHLFGMHLPMRLLGNDPLLKRTKLIVEDTRAGEIYDGKAEPPEYRNLASYRDDFRADARKFLKGDEDMLYRMGEHFRQNREYEAVIHHLTDYRGFTLMDLVSYDRKHNEENGEENRDGSDYNYSWNCGVEGASRRRSVWQLRLSQRKNAMSFLLLSQGVPLILAGDEFGHTTGGNNNAYCQDNKVNWLNWRFGQAGEQLLDFTRKLTRFRMSHPVLHTKKVLRIMDYLSCGYPDISYHGEQAWYTRFENYNRHLGIMYCGLYEQKPDRTNDDFIYIALNMHWTAHDFALPILPTDYSWEITYATAEVSRGDEGGWLTVLQKDGQRMIQVPARSILVLTGRRHEPVKKTRRKRANTVAQREKTKMENG